MRLGFTRGTFDGGRFVRNLAAVLVVCGSAAIGGVGYRHVIEPDLVPKNAGVVVPGAIYRSGELTPAATRQVVERHGIRTIIDFGAHEPGSSEEVRAQRVAAALGVTRHRFNLGGDATGDPNEYVEAMRIALDPGNQPVLVHCAAGSERTGCFVILYRHHIEGVPIDEAYGEAMTHRHDPERNPRLRVVLERYAEAVGYSLKTGERIPFDAGLRFKDQPAVTVPFGGDGPGAGDAPAVEERER